MDFYRLNISISRNRYCTPVHLFLAARMQIKRRPMTGVDSKSNQDTDMYLTCPVVYKRFWFVQCVGSRTDGMPTVDQSDMRGLGTA